MESLHIPIGDLCNMGCTFCGIARRSHRDLATIARDLRDQAVDRVSFGGGEPTIHPHIAEVLTLASGAGFSERQLETNAIRFSQPDFLESLVGAGLTHARVMLPAADDATWDAVTRLEGKCDLAWEGLRGLLAAGVSVDVVIPLSQTNVGAAARIVARLRREGLQPKRLIARPVFYAHDALMREATASGGKLTTLSHGSRVVWDQAQAEILSFDALATELSACFEASRDSEMTFQVDAPSGIPLCALKGAQELLPSVASDSGGGSRPEACTACTLYEQCSGQHPVHQLVHGTWQITPYRTIPRVMNRHDVTETTLFLSSGVPVGAPHGSRKAEIRVVMPCNQRCSFCFVNRNAPTAGLQELRSAVDEAHAAAVDAIIFTGGEPTLSPHLVELLERARATGVACRGIQTNALKLAKGDLVDRLVEAGLNHAHVSLHDVDPARYLAITGFGTPQQTLEGARRLMERGVALSISLVINQVNVDHLLETVRTIHRELPLAWLVVAVAREHPTVTRAWHQSLVRYGKAGPAVSAVMQEAKRLGLRTVGAGTCGLPPCVLDADAIRGDAPSHARKSVDYIKVQAGDQDAEALLSHTFLPSCERCHLKSNCPGIDGNYLSRYGGSEFIPMVRLSGAGSGET